MTTADATYRANPAYEVVSFERLTPEERRALNGAAGEEELYGLLRPRDGSALAPRSASTSVALLVLSLGEPGPLPTFAVRGLGETADGTVERLVLDGVLEVERNGNFVSGASALESRGPARQPKGRVARVSLDALRHAQKLEGVPPELLALRLYSYGRRPLTPALRARLPDENAVGRFLGLGRVGGSWVESGTRPGDPWRMWRPRRAPATGGRSGFKLYVGADLEALPEAFGTLVDGLGRAGGVAGFKVARETGGLCRPDKLVAYFGRFEDLREVATQLRSSLAGLPAQPVPFTAGVSEDGVLSWGIDPPPTATRPSSWRLWLVERLATYLVEGRAQDTAVAPWKFALGRLQLDGVNTATWAPVSTAWDGSP